MNLSVAGQWATVASPLVASSVFVVTIWLDRRRRAHERYAAALDQARFEVLRAVHWAGLPGITHVVGGGGVVRSFNAVSSFVLCLPRRYTPVALWLMQGATYMTTASHAGDRTDAQTQVLGVLVTLTPGSRPAFKAAEVFVQENPWSEVETGTPRWIERAIGPVFWLMRLASGDSTYGVASKLPASGQQE